MKKTCNSEAALPTFIALIALLMLPNFIWYSYDHGIEVLLKAVFIPSFVLLLYFAVLGNRLWLACLLLVPFAALSPVESVYIWKYGQPSTASVLATIFASNLREIREYLHGLLLLLSVCMAGAVLLALAAALWSRRAHLSWRQRSRTWVLVLAFTAPIIGTAVAFAMIPHMPLESMPKRIVDNSLDAISSGYPAGVISRYVQYMDQWQQMRNSAEQRSGFRFQAHRVGAGKKRQVYVLALGESSKRDQWELFGYDRPTNPELKQITNLIPIKDMLTPWPVSLQAIPQLLTRRPATDGTNPWPEPSISRVMQEAGFETYWLSNQMPIGELESQVSVYAHEAKHLKFVNFASWTSPGSYDADLLQPLLDVLASSTDDQFIVLHMMGSHVGYDYRYPPEFKHFRPTVSNPDEYVYEIEPLRNSYDNTILYTDYVLAQVIKILQKTDAITALWYESDHGEALLSETCEVFGHGNGSKFDYQIPAFFWYSDSYLVDHQNLVTAIRENSGKRTLSADTFESLIDMTGVTFPTHDEHRSLFSSSWQFRPRIVNFPKPTDFDEAAFSPDCEIVLPPVNHNAG